MENTTFSIELQGLNLPDDVKSRLQGELQSVVLSEIAKIDLSKELSVRPLPESSGRVFSHVNPILGFVVQKLSQVAQRGSFGNAPSLLFTPPDSVVQAQALLGSATSMPLFEGAPLADVLEGLCLRPDVRAAIVSNSRAFAELLSRDEQAVQTLAELIGTTTDDQPGTQRKGPIPVGIVVVGAAVGALIGWYAPRQR